MYPTNEAEALAALKGDDADLAATAVEERQAILADNARRFFKL